MYDLIGKVLIGVVAISVLLSSLALLSAASALIGMYVLQVFLHGYLISSTCLSNISFASCPIPVFWIAGWFP
ncbi:MAG: hypothetical protein AWU58_1860 [Methanohalophilus sp. T328-1]|nr:MAG: hypothetical protein AWU58_1860 [Methanohalophilus sp. T328-1]